MNGHLHSSSLEVHYVTWLNRATQPWCRAPKGQRARHHWMQPILGRCSSWVDMCFCMASLGLWFRAGFAFLPVGPADIWRSSDVPPDPPVCQLCFCLSFLAHWWPLHILLLDEDVLTKWGKNAFQSPARMHCVLLCWLDKEMSALVRRWCWGISLGPSEQQNFAYIPFTGGKQTVGSCCFAC